MSENVTNNLDGGRTFEERVFARFDLVDARFDEVDSAIRDLDSRVERLEIRSLDTKPIWEQALKEIIETRGEVVATKRELLETRREVSKRLDRIDAIVLENRADIRDAEDRIEKLEAKPVQ